MSLTYTRDIPDPPSSPSVDVPNMKVNTNSIDTIWTRDHFSFSSATAGLHNRVQLVEIGTTLPVGLAAVGSSILFAKTAGNPVQGELFYYRIGALSAIQMTGPNTPNTLVNNGVSFLPGGLMIQWGLFFGAVQGNNVITFSPVFQNQCLNVNLSCVSVTGNVVAVVVTGTVSTSGFTANLSPVIPLVPVQISWVAIGY